MKDLRKIISVPTPVGDRKAPPGYVWICQACGKESKDLYGDKDSKGWDASCVMGAILVKK